jgi:DUF4097 and DUF4098 domain-containing protein YvlB
MNRIMTSAALVGATGMAASLLIAAPASADEIACRGTLGAVTVDNLRVPQGATCTLDKTTVKGNITVKGNATLVATGVRVNGNVQAENAKRVVVKGGSRVGGSVQVKQGGAARVAWSQVNADIQFDANRRQLTAVSATVGGNIQVMQNTGGVEIRNNKVDGNLQCKANSPAPVGGGNVVKGSKEDQCAKL